MDNTMTKGRLFVKPKVAFLVANRKSKLFKIDSKFKMKLDQYLLENNIRIINTDYVAATNEIIKTEVNYGYWIGLQILLDQYAVFFLLFMMKLFETQTY